VIAESPPTLAEFRAAVARLGSIARAVEAGRPDGPALIDALGRMAAMIGPFKEGEGRDHLNLAWWAEDLIRIMLAADHPPGAVRPGEVRALDAIADGLSRR
jgi:hypothetical protein